MNISEHPLARHNFPNYNFAFHQIFYMQGMRKEIDTHFFFPLLRTPRVLLNLLEMWKIIATDLGWPHIETLSVLTDPTYSKDPAFEMPADAQRWFQIVEEVEEEEEEEEALAR